MYPFRYLKNCFALIFLLFFTINASVAGTIVVTTNADSGAGSLREAIGLAAANGTVTIDSILFDIADTSRDARTITLVNQLPDLSSNLIIDASTQQGGKIGYSDAKIILLLSKIQLSAFFFFNFEGTKNVQIYGFFFYKNFSTLFNPGQTNDAGIRFNACEDVIIGKPGKGNYFRGVYYGVFNPLLSYNDSYKRNSTNIIIQSNVFGHNENGEPAIQDYPGSFTYADPVTYAINAANSKDIFIGGDLPSFGNSFFSEKIQVLSEVAENGSLIFKNNNAGTKTDGTIFGMQSNSGITIRLGSTISWPYTPNYKIDIINNLIIGGIEVYYNSGFLKVQGNKLFSPNTSIMGATYNMKLNIGLCTGGGIIGGELPEQQNEIFTRSCLQTSTDWNGAQLPKGLVISSSPNIAIVKNKTYGSAVYGAGIYVLIADGPVIRIDSTAVNFVRGKATPGCKIEVFLDDGCWACDGELFLGRTTSNADSSWSFTGTFNGVVIATAARADSTTSGYTEPFYRLDTVKIVEPTCGLANGSIKGIYGFESTESVEWHRLTFDFNVFPYITDTVVATTPDLLNVAAGSYYFVAKLGQTCHSASFYYTLKDFTPVIDDTNVSITQPACGLFNGTIGNILITNGLYSAYQWVNDQNVVLSSGDAAGSSYSYLTNLSSGKYRLIVTDNRKGCADTSSYFTLVNQSGPNLNLNSAKINFAKCGNSNGSITDIAVNNATGTQSIQWTDSLNNIIGNGFNLLNVKAGKYRLRFKDQSTCDTIITSFFEVKDTTVIILNIAGRIVKPAGCGSSNGSISNVIATNASNFTWKNMNGFATVGNTLNISGLASGFYQLTAGNAFGCSDNSNGIYVANTTFEAITVTDFSVTNAGCNNAQGKIDITSFSKPSSGYSFRWIDSASNLQLATGNTISGLGKGNYLLLAKDSNGCEQKIFSEFVDSLPTPFLSFAGMVVTNDICSGKVGGITGLTIKDLTGPTTYKWTDVNNIVSFGNQLTLSNMGAGEYKLLVNDAGCGIATSLITIGNDLNAGTAPQYKDVIVSKNSAATLTVTNFERGTYILFADAAGQQEIQRNTTGVFITAPIAANTSFYVKHIAGTCSSRLVEINVSTVDNSYFTIPKAFTPNGDLLNNLLTVRVVGFIKLGHFRIFNRYGQVVFETSQINDKWDGKYKGKDLPDGAYIWTAEGMDITGKIIRDKGTVMILR
jgi:gliding motility-associated-like protein